MTSGKIVDTLEAVVFPKIQGDETPLKRGSRKEQSDIPAKKTKQIQIRKKSLTRGFKRKR